MLRRTFMLGAMAGAVVPSAPALGATEARRVFRIMRSGSDIGRHVLSARLDGDAFAIDIDVDIAVKLLGFTAYRYELTNRERWKGGAILSVDSRVNGDGDNEYAKIKGGVGGLEIDGSGYSGQVSREAVTTSYFAPEFLNRRPWVSTQSGKPLEVDIRNAAGSGPVRVTGELETTLIYDQDGEWTGSRFDARGEEIRYDLIEESGNIADLWRSA